MAIDIEKRDDALIFRPDGPSLTFENHQEIREAFTEAVPQEPKKVILDLENIRYLDSVGLGSIVSGRLSLRGKCGIHLCGLNKSVEATIRFARLDLIFPVHDSVDSALKAE